MIDLTSDVLVERVTNINDQYFFGYYDMSPESPDGTKVLVNKPRFIDHMPMVDDELEISLKLDGNGEELNTFLVKEETPGSKETAVEIDFNDLPEETLSDDKEFTDKDNGKLGFKDGVSQTQIGIRANVQQVTEDGVKLKFYLFSKPVNCEGAKYELEIKTSDKQDD